MQRIVKDRRGRPIRNHRLAEILAVLFRHALFIERADLVGGGCRAQRQMRLGGAGPLHVLLQLLVQAVERGRFLAGDLHLNAILAG